MNPSQAHTAKPSAAPTHKKSATEPKPETKRVLIEDWLPAAAIGVECMRERGSASALAPHTFLHVWWARRPLTVSRAAVLASLIPADFPHDIFERLIGFGRPSKQIVEIRRWMDTGVRVAGGFGYDRAFKRPMRDTDLSLAHAEMAKLWGGTPTVLDCMAGGGSIPLEASRIGVHALANEYNPVACCVLEATVDYPIRFGVDLAKKARSWGRKWIERIDERLGGYFPKHEYALVHAYIFARTVACPETGHQTPLVPDWHVLKPANHDQCDHRCLLAVPFVDKKTGEWTVDFKRGDKLRDKKPPRPTYENGKGVSLFSNLQIPSDYINAKAQAGEMSSTMYAVALKTNEGLKFITPGPEEEKAIARATAELKRVRTGWEKENVIPTEKVPEGDKTREALVRGFGHWADMFASRQLLCMGVLVEELKKLRKEILSVEGKDVADGVVHLLAFALDKFANHNCSLNRWETTRAVVKGKMDRHDFAFKPAYAEMAPCGAGNGVQWVIDNVTESFERISSLPRSDAAKAVEISFGSAVNLPTIADRSITAVVVDPPYADNVQYSELADFFYVWLKRTLGYRHSDWFGTYLCDHDEEAVVNITRNRKDKEQVKVARERAHKFYQNLMTASFRESHRILRDDGVLTVMFTHKKQEAWEALFQSLIDAGFRISATWPVKTESEHSLHQARKNAAQSTVLLVARKRSSSAPVGYFDASMQQEIRHEAQTSAERFKAEGLNPVDQLVGSFGPAMAVYSRYQEVRTDTGERVSVQEAIDQASQAVTNWRIEQLAARGLGEIDAESRFALLCWDVLGAAEFRFNEAHLLGKAVGMDIDQLIAAGLVEKEGDKVRMLSARDRRRSRPLEREEYEQGLFGPIPKGKKRNKKEDVLKVHPNDPGFRTALDGCHALALRYLEAGAAGAGVGSAKALVRQQNWNAQSPVARLMQALVEATPEALRHEKGKTSVAAKFPEFRAWHALMEPLFGFTAPDWTEQAPPQAMLALTPVDEEAELEISEDEDEETDE
ncbi:MAG TPA: DUF1156 domain-containing protein [Candidatus Nanoarchaeia archaeon]|nr:DUF1156 domain-containing protein [Candidatus Nanoarchaeia archaeon]